jgi:outer membrane protein OmpA-like peptidoglycan-associated protein
MTSAFQNVLNDTIGKVKFNNGTSYGCDAQVGYFFGRKRHFGLGLGFMYLSQKGDLTLDQYRLEYKSLDSHNDTFRQIVTADGPIKETVTVTNINIPLVLKYKTQFSPRWGMTVDAGLLFNVQMSNAYTTNATFDYEAIYKVASDGSRVYDYSPTPGGGDFLVTKAEYMKDNPHGDMTSYFDLQRSKAGYNVGLNKSPNSTSGTVTYKATVGFLVQPSLTLRLSDYVFLNLGAYYMMHSFDNSGNNSNYMLTNKVGEYNPLMNSISKSQNSSYGLNAGVRIYLDRDMFGERTPRVRRRKERPMQSIAETPAPVPAPAPHVSHIVKSEEKAPVLLPEPKRAEPMPEPKAAPLYTELPIKVIHFETGKDIVNGESCRKLDQVARFMKDYPEVTLNISGFADNTGSENKNVPLSKERAEQVKKYLEYKGIDGNRMSTNGFGSKDPLGNNKTAGGRAENRRVELKVK